MLPSLLEMPPPKAWRKPILRFHVIPGRNYLSITLVGGSLYPGSDGSPVYLRPIDIDMDSWDAGANPTLIEKVQEMIEAIPLAELEFLTNELIEEKVSPFIPIRLRALSLTKNAGPTGLRRCRLHENCKICTKNSDTPRHVQNAQSRRIRIGRRCSTHFAEILSAQHVSRRVISREAS